MPLLPRLWTMFKIGAVSAWLAWQKLGYMQKGDEIHFHFIFKWEAPKPPA